MLTCFVETEAFQKFKKSLQMHESTRVSVKEKKLFLSSDALSHFCLSDFSVFFFFISLHGGYGEKNIFVLTISELNFIPPPFGWNGTGTDKRPMMRKHVQHKPPEPPL